MDDIKSWPVYPDESRALRKQAYYKLCDLISQYGEARDNQAALIADGFFQQGTTFGEKAQSIYAEITNILGDQLLSVKL